MHRYKKKKSKVAGKRQDQKSDMQISSEPGNQNGDNPQSNKKIDSIESLDTSSQTANISGSEPSHSTRVKKLKKQQNRLTDLTMLKSAIDHRQASTETKTSKNLRPSPSPSSLISSSHIDMEKNSSQDISIQSSCLSGKNPSSAVHHDRSENQETARGKLSAQSDDSELFRSAVERINQQDIQENKVVDRDGRSSKKHIAQSRAAGGKKLLIKMDLHGLTVEKAKMSLENLMQQLELRGGCFEIDIVTGKGLGSEAGPVLAREIPSFIRERFGPNIISMESSPMETALGGIPMRGSFKVTIEWKQQRKP